MYDISIKSDQGGLQWTGIHFIDDTEVLIQAAGSQKFSYEQFKRTFLPSECRVVIAHGEPRIRRILAEKVRGDNYTLGSVIDPTARISSSARLGAGIILFPYTYISNSAVIGDNALISVGSAIGHDSIIGDNTVVSSLASVSGHCSIGEDCYIGTSACIKEKVRIGKQTIIGMGSCVFRDIAAGMIALGNPAREMRSNVEQKIFDA
jgi:sugar O-acyltransferase (sialic acid O-acetyltransferase NeuD family)